MKPDEQKLLAEAQKRADEFGLFGARSLATEIGIHPKRAAYIYEKWCGRGWYECGVSIMAGWLTEKGKQQGKST